MTQLLFRRIWRARLSTPFIITVLFLSSCASFIRHEGAPVAKADWDTHRVGPGVVWKYYHFDDLFDSRQSVTVFDIDLRKVKVDIHYVDSGFFATSEVATSAGALAAINGSFFDTKVGGSVVFFQYEGERIRLSSPNPKPYWEAAGFAIDPSGAVSIMIPPDGGWSRLDSKATVLTSGPLLVYDGDPIAQMQESFNTHRHPRTAVGLTKKNHLIAVVVDGRASEAHGMTTAELALVMDALRCREAMNLDGGGSSTAWVRDEGVVNHPSDNKRFDHAGERRVSNCILFSE